MVDFDRPVVFASDCAPCSDCGEPVCPTCADHYADCACPGPDSEPETTHQMYYSKWSWGAGENRGDRQ